VASVAELAPDSGATYTSIPAGAHQQREGETRAFGS
jgi:hypothetical protein